jgi:uncharacterized protein YxjI
MRRRRQERKQEHGSGGPTRYKMHEKLVSIGDDFYIEDQNGRKTFYVDGKALRVRDTLIIKDMQRNVLCKIQEKKLRVKDTMNIEGPDGATLATIKKALISPVRDRWSVKIADGPDMEVKGNILDHEYKIEEGRTRIAEVSKKWFRVRDMYGVEVAPGQNDVVILAITVGIDMMR